MAGTAIHHRFHAMGSPCEIRLRNQQEAALDKIVQKLVREIQRLEQRYSRFLPDSITTTINRTAGLDQPVAIDDETASLLDYADTCFQQSAGLFDITSGSLRSLWNYQQLVEQQVLPTQERIREALEKVGWSKVQRTADAISLPIPGMEIDFGGIVKEYAADCVARLAEAEGIASGMVDLGGDIRLFGIQLDSSPWQVGIRDPFATDRALAVIGLKQGGLATSGDYERYSLINGKRYSHILNPLTGWPVEGFSSVSVLADQCVIAGSAASIAVLMGHDGEQWLQALGLPFLCIDQDGQATGTIELNHRY